MHFYAILCNCVPSITFFRVMQTLRTNLRSAANLLILCLILFLLQTFDIDLRYVLPGDRLLSVNGETLDDLSHAEAIQLLRGSPPSCKLELARVKSSLYSSCKTTVNIGDSFGTGIVCMDIISLVRNYLRALGGGLGASI